MHKKINASHTNKCESISSRLMKHVEETSKEVRNDWPRWKRTIFKPRKPRNGFKI